MTRRHPIILLTAVAALLAGCGSDDEPTSSAPSSNTSAPAAGGGSDAVKISNFKFVPASLSAGEGAGITVTNDDSTTHTATADDGGFDTGNLDPGSSKTITVAKPGSYAYHCTIHPFMKGTIVVK